MRVDRGAEKLGPNVTHISREVGPTCPQDCYFLNKGCYAERAQEAPATLRRWRANNLVRSVSAAKRRLATWKAEGKVRALRLHVGGDFLWEGRLDERYCSLVENLLRDVDVPAWVYTHCWRDLGRWLWRFKRVGCEVFASVHDDQAAHEAAALGFRIAYCSSLTKEGWEIAHSASLKGWHKRKAWKVGGQWCVVCPEQIDIKEDCESCGLCFSDTTDVGVIFLEH